MIEVDQVHDPEKLRSVVMLLDREVERLRQQVRDLGFENARLRGETAAQVDFGFSAVALARLLAAGLERASQPYSTATTAAARSRSASASAAAGGRAAT